MDSNSKILVPAPVRVCSNSNIELECIIDKKIDISTFRNLISRLKGKDDIFYNEEKKSKKSGGKPLKANPAVSSKKPAKPRKANAAYDGRVYQLRPPESTSYTSSKKDRYIGNGAGDREVILGTDLRFESQETKQNQMTSQLKKTLKSLEKSIGSTEKTSTLIVEGANNDKAQ